MLQFMGSQRVGQYLATEEEEQQQSISGEADLSNDTAGLKGAAPPRSAHPGTGGFPLASEQALSTPLLMLKVPVIHYTV